jgi:hypothetical protein
MKTKSMIEAYATKHNVTKKRAFEILVGHAYADLEVPRTKVNIFE